MFCEPSHKLLKLKKGSWEPLNYNQLVRVMGDDLGDREVCEVGAVLWD